METRLQKLENSDGIGIPSDFLKSLNSKTNDKVELIQEKDKISLEERFESFDGEDLTKEFVWDEAKGKEI